MRTFRLLRGTALGDAFGAGLEYLPPGRTSGFGLGWGFLQNPRYPEISPGQFTDDTMLSVAAARALLVDLGAGRNPREDSFYAAMADLHRLHPSSGYSKPTREALAKGSDGPSLKQAYRSSEPSQGNGAAMRSAVYGILPDVGSALAAAETCAAATHADEGVAAARAVAAASHYAIHWLGPREGMHAFVAHHAGAAFAVPYTGRVAYAQDRPIAELTVRAALTALRNADGIVGVIEACIRPGGDTDTVAAIGNGIAACCPWIADDAPPGLWQGDGIVSVSGLGWEALARLDFELGLTLGRNPRPAS